MINSTRILTTSCTNPHNNLALEDALLQSLPENQALLFLWQNKHTVVIGAGQNAWRECNTALLEQEHGTLARRSTGGGAVYHDLGNLNFSFIMPKEDYDVARQLRVVMDALRELGIQAEATGRNDISADGRKFSGNAFRLLKKSCLHHGTLMVDVDVPMLPRFLNVDPTKLMSKGVKSVPSRVVNLSELKDVTVEDVRQAMIHAFMCEYGDAPVEETDGSGISLYENLLPKYESWDWNYGASPAGESNLLRRFDWGSLELHFAIRNGLLQGVQVYTDAMDETLHEQLKEALEGAPYDGNELTKRANALGMPDVADALGKMVC